MDLDEIDINTNILDLSGKNYDELPEKVLKFKNVRMLCLDNNQLTNLTPNLFEELSKLKWLDLRNNRLQQLPPTINKCTTLETLILQNNQIQELPVELGFLTNLKTLHLSGNPLLFPMPDVVQQGLSAIQKCLIERLETKIYPQTAPSKTEKVHKKKAQKRRNFVPPKKNCSTLKSHQLVQLRRSKSALSTILPPVEVKPYSDIIEGSSKTAPEPERHLNTEVDLKEFSIKPKSAFETGDFKKYSKFPITNSERYLSSPNITRSGLRQQEQNLMDIWTLRLRQLLEKQASLIQKQKTVEALKSWRQQIGKFNQRSCLNYANKSELPPFDTDPNYDKMPTRHELHQPLKEFKPKSLPSEKIDINAKIDEIIKSIKCLDTLQSSTMSPHQEQIILDREIKRLNQIQMTLSTLKYLNDDILQ